MERHEVESDDGTVPVHVARPDGEPRAGLVVVHEAFGVNDHIQDVCSRFAAEGYLVAAPSLFHRFDRQVLRYDEIGEAKELLARLTVPQLLNDVEAARQWLVGPDGVPGKPIALIGYCFGGRVSFVAATRLSGWAVAASYYGGGIGADAPDAPVTRVGDLACPMLATFGGSDPMIPMDEVSRVRQALEAQSPENEVYVYDDAGHGFFCDARPQAFHPEAAADVWAKTLAFFDRHTK